MGQNTKISWTDHTFNPWIGCTKVSAGCRNCYAEALAKRYGFAEWGAGNQRHRTSPSNWNGPRRWNRKATKAGTHPRVFCASLADVFDAEADHLWRADLFALIRDTPNLVWQILTKRPENYEAMLPEDWPDAYRNVWLGISAEDQQNYNARWPFLARVPAAVRFVSYEPALGPLLTLTMERCNRDPDEPLPDWLICGGESGPRARPLEVAWVRNIRDECAGIGTAFFMKQWGTYRNNPLVTEVGMSQAAAARCDPPVNGKGGAGLDGKLWYQFPPSLLTESERLASAREL